MRWGKWVICRVEVGPGQPAGQVGLEPLHLLLLLLEEQLCSSQISISCPLILPTGRREEVVGRTVWYCQKAESKQFSVLWLGRKCVYTHKMPKTICVLFHHQREFVNRHSNSSQFYVMPQIREIGTAVCKCHTGWPHYWSMRLTLLCYTSCVWPRGLHSRFFGGFCGKLVVQKKALRRAHKYKFKTYTPPHSGASCGLHTITSATTPKF